MRKTMKFRAGAIMKPGVQTLFGNDKSKPVSESDAPQVSENSDPAGFVDWMDEFNGWLNSRTPEELKWAWQQIEEKRRQLDQEEPETVAPDEYKSTHATKNTDQDDY